MEVPSESDTSSSESSEDEQMQKVTLSAVMNPSPAKSGRKAPSATLRRVLYSTSDTDSIDSDEEDEELWNKSGGDEDKKTIALNNEVSVDMLAEKFIPQFGRVSGY